MIDYDPHAWARHLITVRGSVLPRIAGRLLLVGAWAGAIAWVHRTHRLPALPGAPHALVGAALCLLLVFRTNSAYDRFWEGRKRWSSLTSRVRDFTRQAVAWIDDAPELTRRLVAHAVAFAHVTRRHLRGETRSDELRRFLSGGEVAAITKADHRPLAVAGTMTAHLREARDGGRLGVYDAMALDADVGAMLDDLGACERILRTPMPFAYVMHLRRFLAIWCLTIPFVLVDQGWAMPVASVLIAYALLGIEEIGVQIEDPFGHDRNDLPLDEICKEIERDCLGVLARGGVPIQGEPAARPRAQRPASRPAAAM